MALMACGLPTPVRSLAREKKNRRKEENNRNRTRRGTCGRKKKRTKLAAETKHKQRMKNIPSVVELKNNRLQDSKSEK
jgi:hypothetical protein